VSRKDAVTVADTEQHWVPQFLLRGFHNGNEKSIFVGSPRFVLRRTKEFLPAGTADFQNPRGSVGVAGDGFGGRVSSRHDRRGGLAGPND
jgi:hypothetical protein